WNVKTPPRLSRKECTISGHLTMYRKVCAALVLVQISGGAALAVDGKTTAAPPPGPAMGTPEEQSACAPDSNRFCRDAIPDTFRVLACLQEHRHRLRKACRRVLEEHGQ